jgi:hypothetical protein
VPLRTPAHDEADDRSALDLAQIAAALWAGEAVPADVRSAFRARAAGLAPSELLALMGGDNRSLHAPEGLELVDRFVAGLGSKRPDEAIQLTNGWIERAMRGSLPESAPAARASVDRVYAEHLKLVRRVVCDPADLTRARSHLVGDKEYLDKISSRYRREGLLVESGLLMAVNRIDDARRLRAGQSLKIPTDPVRTVIDKSSFLAAVYLGDVILRLYWIGHGKEDRTPEAVFEIGKKQQKPDWTFEGRVIPYGHPDNVLGDYFVEFRHASYSGFGAHGTPDAASIGRAQSLGCIRMRDRDIAEFFWLVPRGTPVEIRATRLPG